MTTEVLNEMSSVTLTGIRSVAVIGAGVSGILATRYLRDAGLEVIVFERNSRAGGVWIYDDVPPPESPYPATNPLQTALRLCPWHQDKDRPPEVLQMQEHADWITAHAPSGPCYAGLTNNFSVLAMEIKDHPWPWHIPVVTPANPDHASEWTTHDRVLDHLQAAASRFGLEEKVLYRTLVERIYKSNNRWALRTSTLTPLDDNKQSYIVDNKDWEFDAVVVASGHFNIPRIPDIPGLAHWRKQYPDRVQHSRTYRHPEVYIGQNVLLVGGGTSSTEIARELESFARNIYQSGRGSAFDLPLDLLPPNCKRMGEIARFNTQDSMSNGSLSGTDKRPIPSSITFCDGTLLDDIHCVIVCTGYHYAYPFLQDLHSQCSESEKSEIRPIVSDGTCTLNLHKDMFYIPDPTLAFVGISQFIATFPFFEFQNMAIADVFAGKASLPNRVEMEALYAERLRKRGATKFMNARMDEEVSYIDELIAWLNEANPDRHISGFSSQWHAVRDAGKLHKIRLRFAREKAEKEHQIWNGQVCN